MHSTVDLSLEQINAHDQQREIPKEAQIELLGKLSGALRGCARCLDAGIGSGSISLPLAQAGIPVIGLDLSRSMLNTLQGKAHGSLRIPLVQADMTHLPFDVNVFDAALTSNVWHLLLEWRIAVSEILRVAKPGGLFLVNLGGHGTSVPEHARILSRFQELLGESWSTGPQATGPRSEAEFTNHLLATGAVARSPLQVWFEQPITFEDVIARLQRNVYARPFRGAQGGMDAVANDVRMWVMAEMGPLDQVRTVTREIVYNTYVLA